MSLHLKSLTSGFSLILTALALAESAIAAPGVTLRVKRAGAPEAAPSPEAMLFMMNKPSRRLNTYTLENIVPVQSGKDSQYNWYRGSWQNPVYLAEFSGNLKIKDSGRYAFEVSTSAPVYLWVDDNMLIDHPQGKIGTTRSAAEPVRTASAPLDLKAGAAKVRIITMCRNQLDLALRWKTPKSPNDFTGVVNADWLEAPTYRNLGESTPYSFSTVKGSFCPKLGDDGTVKRVDFRKDIKPLVEYRLSADMAGLPAICDENDRIRPELQCRTTAPESVPVTFEATVITTAGGATATNSFEGTFAFDKGWGRLAIPEHAVRDLKSIKWSASHRGVAIASGLIEFLQSPYDVIPDDIRNDAFYAGGTRIVLVTSRGKKPQRKTRNAGDSASEVAKILVLDGFISSSAAGGAAIGELFDSSLTNEMQDVSYKRITADTVSTSGPVPFSSSALNAILSACKAEKTSTVIIAPEIKGAYYGESLADFEKKLLAETNFLRDALECELILVTPPEGLLDEFEPNTTRDYASAIHLAADLAGAKTIDLFTLGKTSKTKYADTQRNCLNEDGAILLSTKLKNTGLK